MNPMTRQTPKPKNVCALCTNLTEEFVQACQICDVATCFHRYNWYLSECKAMICDECKPINLIGQCLSCTRSTDEYSICNLCSQTICNNCHAETYEHKTMGTTVCRQCMAQYRQIYQVTDSGLKWITMSWIPLDYDPCLIILIAVMAEETHFQMSHQSFDDLYGACDAQSIIGRHRKLISRQFHKYIQLALLKKWIKSI